MIPYGRQWVSPQDARAVLRVLRSDHLTQGPEIERFEEAFARAVSAPYAVAVSSGTAGLHLAALAAGFASGDEVITSPVTFVATSNAVLYAGAKPVFADIEPRSIGLDPDRAREALTRRTRGLISVHFAGRPSLVASKSDVSAKKDLVVIEDACHALGAEVRRRGAWTKIGACHGTDMSVFSFHPVKHITTGEGGMVTTRRKDLYERLKLLRSHGIEKNPKNFSRSSGAGQPWYYEMTTLGFNYRITELQCALGLSQLKRLGSFVEKRRRIAEYYSKALSGLTFVTAPSPDTAETRSSWHLYVLRIDFKKLGVPREALMRGLASRGISTQVHYIPVPMQPYYRRRFGVRSTDLPNARAFYEEALSIPIYPAMTLSDARRVAREVTRLTERACR